MKQLLLVIALLLASPVYSQDNQVSKEDLAKLAVAQLLVDESMHFSFQGITFAQGKDKFIEALVANGWKKDALMTNQIDNPEITVMKGMYNGSIATLTVMYYKDMLPYGVGVTIDTNDFKSAIARRDDLRNKVANKYKVTGEINKNLENQDEWTYMIRKDDDSMDIGKITISAAHRVFDGTTFDSVTISYFDILNIYFRMQGNENDV